MSATFGLLLTFASAAAAASLAFLQPSITSGVEGPLQFAVGEQVEISWTTPYNVTNLKVLQGPLADGSYTEDLLAYQWPSDYTDTVWKTARLSSSDVPYYFQLQKGDQPNDCDACTANSHSFYIGPLPASLTAGGSTTAATSASSSPPSSSSGPTSSSFATVASSSTTQNPSSTLSASSGSSTTSVAASATGTPTADSNMDTVNLGLGLGLGFGFPVIIAFVGLMWYSARRIRRTRSRGDGLETSEPETEQLQGYRYEPSGTLSWISQASRTSYHEPFEFQAPDGSKREGSERLFPNNEDRLWRSKSSKSTRRK